MEKFIATIASVVFPVDITINQTNISNNKYCNLLCITATQMIVHYSLNFDVIQKSFKRLSLYSLDSVGKNFKGIVLVVMLVGVTKNCKQFLVMFA